MTRGTPASISPEHRSPFGILGLVVGLALTSTLPRTASGNPDVERGRNGRAASPAARGREVTTLRGPRRSLVHEMSAFARDARAMTCNGLDALFRGPFGAGRDRQLKMSRGVARRLVDRREWDLRRVGCTWQEPLGEAVHFLRFHRDVASVPQLRLLFEAYVPSEPAPEPAREGRWDRLSYREIEGPHDYIPRTIQLYTANALLDLMDPPEGTRFASDALRTRMAGLTQPTIAVLTRHLRDHIAAPDPSPNGAPADAVIAWLPPDVRDLGPLLLAEGELRLRRFETDERRLHAESDSRRITMISFADLHAFHDLAAAALRVLEDPDLAGHALDMLVAAYNHPDAFEPAGGRPRQGSLMLDVLDHLPTDRMRAETIDRLDPDRYQRDRDRYRQPPRAPGELPPWTPMDF